MSKVQKELYDGFTYDESSSCAKEYLDESGVKSVMSDADYSLRNNELSSRLVTLLPTIKSVSLSFSFAEPGMGTIHLPVGFNTITSLRVMLKNIDNIINVMPNVSNGVTLNINCADGSSSDIREIYLVKKYISKNGAIVLRCPATSAIVLRALTGECSNVALYNHLCAKYENLECDEMERIFDDTRENYDATLEYIHKNFFVRDGVGNEVNRIGVLNTSDCEDIKYAHFLPVGFVVRNHLSNINSENITLRSTGMLFLDLVRELDMYKGNYHDFIKMATQHAIRNRDILVNNYLPKSICCGDCAVDLTMFVESFNTLEESMSDVTEYTLDIEEPHLGEPLWYWLSNMSLWQLHVLFNPVFRSKVTSENVLERPKMKDDNTIGLNTKLVDDIINGGIDPFKSSNTKKESLTSGSDIVKNVRKPVKNNAVGNHGYYDGLTYGADNCPVEYEEAMSGEWFVSEDEASMVASRVSSFDCFDFNRLKDIVGIAVFCNANESEVKHVNVCATVDTLDVFKHELDMADSILDAICEYGVDGYLEVKFRNGDGKCEPVYLHLRGNMPSDDRHDIKYMVCPASSYPVMYAVANRQWISPLTFYAILDKYEQVDMVALIKVLRGGAKSSLDMFSSYCYELEENLGYEGVSCGFVTGNLTVYSFLRMCELGYGIPKERVNIDVHSKIESLTKSLVNLSDEQGYAFVRGLKKHININDCVLIDYYLMKYLTKGIDSSKCRKYKDTLYNYFDSYNDIRRDTYHDEFDMSSGSKVLAWVYGMKLWEFAVAFNSVSHEKVVPCLIDKALHDRVETSYKSADVGIGNSDFDFLSLENLKIEYKEY